MKIKQAVNGYIIKVLANEKFNDKTESGIYIDTKINHQQYIKQYAEIVSVGKDTYGVEAGDILIFHYNILSHAFAKGAEKESQYLLFTDGNEIFYTVPCDMAHAIINKSGEIVMLNNYCFIKPYKKEEVKTKSGIISELGGTVDGANKLETTITHISYHDELNIGDKVLLDTYANYEIKLPYMNVWAIRTGDVLCKFLSNA